MSQKISKNDRTKTHAHAEHVRGSHTEATESAPITPSAGDPPATIVSAPGNLPPTTQPSSPPKGWVARPSRGKARLGQRPKGAQITNAVTMATELTESPTYTADFGSRAPAPGQIEFLVTNAAKWRSEWQAARAYFTYATEQRQAWENAALTQTDSLKGAFAYAASRDSAILEKYGATARFFGATKAISARAAATRKAARDKAAKGKASGPSPAPSPQSTPNPPDPK